LSYEEYSKLGFIRFDKVLELRQIVVGKHDYVHEDNMKLEKLAQK